MITVLCTCLKSREMSDWISDTYCTYVLINTVNVREPDVFSSGYRSFGLIFYVQLIFSAKLDRFIQSTSENRTFGFQTRLKSKRSIVRFYIVRISDNAEIRTIDCSVLYRSDFGRSVLSCIVRFKIRLV